MRVHAHLMMGAPRRTARERDDEGSSSPPRDIVVVRKGALGFCSSGPKKEKGRTSSLIIFQESSFQMTEETFTFDRIQEEDRDRVVLCGAAGHRVQQNQEVKDHNKSTLWGERVAHEWVAYDRAPQTKTGGRATEEVTKRDVVNRVNDSIVFLECVDEGDGSLHSMVWKIRMDMGKIIEKTEQKLRDEKAKYMNAGPMAEALVPNQAAALAEPGLTNVHMFNPLPIPANMQPFQAAGDNGIMMPGINPVPFLLQFDTRITALEGGLEERERKRKKDVEEWKKENNKKSREIASLKNRVKELERAQKARQTTDTESGDAGA